MTFTIDTVRPRGRCFDEYQRMFALTAADLSSGILGCGDGPASFSAEATTRGCRAVSCDPLYHFSAAEIDRRVLETADTILAETERNRDDFVWDYFESVEHLGRVRLGAMRRFLEDYAFGETDGRYVDAGSPILPFQDGCFDLASSSHFSFCIRTSSRKSFMFLRFERCA